MENPFFGSHWNLPRRSWASARGIPQTAPSPKVVSIPVHFVGSKRSREESAVGLQKAFRGFLVRKNMRMIAAIRSEAEEIERKISKKETVELIRNDSRERVKFNEMLMSLLFRLDSVKGVDSGVRDCRKAVIRKVIALQEAVDAIQGAAESGLKESAEPSGNGEEVADSNLLENRSTAPKPACFASVCNSAGGAGDQTVESVSVAGESKGHVTDSEAVGESREPEGDAEIKAIGGRDAAEIGKSQEDPVKNEGAAPSGSDDGEESMEASQTESQSGSSGLPESLIEGGDKEGYGQTPAEVEENPSGGTQGRELLERMVEDNEKMMVMMQDLFDRNEMQTRLLSSLSQRVKQLEKVLTCERLRKKKKRAAHATVDGFHRSLAGNK